MKRIADMKHKNEAEVKKRKDEINAAKLIDSNEQKKKLNEPDKRSNECDKSKQIKLPETMTGIVKNSPFQKLDKQANNLNKENKTLINKIDLTPKIQNAATTNKNEIAKPQSNCFNSAKVNNSKWITYYDF